MESGEFEEVVSKVITEISNDLIQIAGQILEAHSKGT